MTRGSAGAETGWTISREGRTNGEGTRCFTFYLQSPPSVAHHPSSSSVSSSTSSARCHLNKTNVFQCPGVSSPAFTSSPPPLHPHLPPLLKARFCALINRLPPARTSCREFIFDDCNPPAAHHPDADARRPTPRRAAVADNDERKKHPRSPLPLPPPSLRSTRASDVPDSGAVLSRFRRVLCAAVVFQPLPR